MRVFLCALSCAVLAASPCLAATVEPDQGSLSINHGQGFEPVGGPMTAKVGRFRHGGSRRHGNGRL